ncbi:MAG: DUF3164 family protein [Bacteroidales bacterium]|nr:DUF3164 family protein [Bacteroidales bacterium]MBR4273826.1 DUF3164 family protein [Bacteroidales bacterium]
MKMTNTVTMTAEEMAEFEAFRKAQAEKRAKEERKQNLDTYNKMINEQVEMTIPELWSLSEQLAAVKDAVFGNFKALLDMKSDVMKMTKDGQRSHTFTSSDGTKRIELGCYTLDNYKDTVNDGIAMIKEYISGLAKDEETQSLVEMVLKLLSKDQKGNLKASRVLQLRALADKSGNAQFKEGVEIIMDAYDPIPSKQFVRAWIKGEQGEWLSIPLSITDAKCGESKTTKP